MTNTSVTSPNNKPFPPPSAEEAKLYYSTPSSPKLIYRTGPTPWDGKPMELSPATHHKLNDAMDDLGPKLLQLLKGVQWTSIDPVGFRNEDTPYGMAPTVLWIGVTPGTLSGEDACAPANRCLDLLKEFGIDDVKIAMRESRVWGAGSMDED